MSEGSNVSAVVQQNDQSSPRHSNEAQDCAQEETLKGTFVQTVYKNNENIPEVNLSSQQHNDDGSVNNSYFESTSTQARQV